MVSYFSLLGGHYKTRSIKRIIYLWYWIGFFHVSWKQPKTRSIKYHLSVVLDRLFSLTHR